VSRAVLLVDHGSRRPQANEQLEALAESVRARLPDRIVLTAHLEIAQPDIAAGIAACAEAGAREVVVHPYFLGPGRHTAEDIPRRVAEAAAAHPDLEIRISQPLGLDERVIDVVVDRIEHGAALDAVRTAPDDRSG
jgi:sirohydrochlorin ferrochelatase